MKTIDEHIQKDQEEFLKALSEHNDGKVRHLTEELQWLLDHKRAFKLVPARLDLVKFQGFSFLGKLL